jgi:type IV pilus assembly protein PilA
VKKSNSFTLIELIVVITIIGILSTIALVSYGKTKENAYEKEAKTNLKLITSAEKIYRIESGSYVNCTNVSEINSQLRLLLPVDNPHWNYKVSATTASTFTGKAGLAAGNNTPAWCINETSDEPYSSSCSF